MDFYLEPDRLLGRPKAGKHAAA